MSLWTNESGGWTLQNITTGLSQAEETETWTRGLSDGVYLWNIEGCDSDGDCVSATSNRTLYVDGTSPLITVASPSGTINYGEVDGTEELNVTFTDEHLDACIYDYNGTNFTIDGCNSGELNWTNFTLETSNTNMTIYVNDTLGNTNYSYIKIEFRK